LFHFLFLFAEELLSYDLERFFIGIRLVSQRIFICCLLSSDLASSLVILELVPPVDLRVETFRVVVRTREDVGALQPPTSHGLLELHDLLAWSEPVPPGNQFIYSVVLQHLKLLQGFLVDELCKSRLLNFLKRGQILLFE